MKEGNTAIMMNKMFGSGKSYTAKSSEHNSKKNHIRLTGNRREDNLNIFRDTEDYYQHNKVLIHSVDRSCQNTKLIRADEYPALDSSRNSKNTDIRVLNEFSLDAISMMRKEYAEKKIGILSFASPIRPASGLRGSSSQDETLCRYTTLYPTLNQDWLWEKFYKKNKKNSPVYTDDCIYSPDVVVCKRSAGSPERLQESDFFRIDVISCAPPDATEGSLERFHERLIRSIDVKHMQNENTAEEISLSYERWLYNIHKKRTQHILHIAAANRIDVLILGAFGCGHYENDPFIVALAFKEALIEYAKYFDKVIFAISGDRNQNNYLVFDKLIKEIKNVQDEKSEGPEEKARVSYIKEGFFPTSIEIESERIFPVPIMAKMSSGKSTLINALMDEDILPSENRACTAKLFSVIDDDMANEMRLYITKKDSGTTSYTKELGKRLWEANQDDSVENILLTGNIRGVANTDRALMIVDTPGQNNAMNKVHEQIALEVLEKLTGGLLLYIIDESQELTTDDDHILEQVRDRMQGTNWRIAFVVNKMDKLDLEKESVEDLTGRIKKHLEKIGFDKTDIIPVSAWAAYLFKKALRQEDFTSKEKRDFRYLYELFKPKGLRLSMLARTEFSVMLDDSIEVGDMVCRRIDLWYAVKNCGIHYLENYIQKVQILASRFDRVQIGIKEP